MIKLAGSLLWWVLVFGSSVFGNEMDPALEAKLAALEAQASEAAAREISFSEKRYFPFRKKPVELEGVMRMATNRGVGIEYPEKRTAVVADSEGVLLRKFSKEGSFMQKNAGRGETDTIDLLKAAFEFDSVALAEFFDMDWVEEGDNWTIAMTPRGEKAEKIERVTIVGTHLEVSLISMAFKGNRRIEIYPRSEEKKAGFSEEELGKYFRGPTE